ncbi:MAG: hypothetical protein M1821_005182 [Bathelium mastoideum]|nr:MAG: hypothetical protein M1821_005182 [Bathelium mastoideum]KAI9689245.1 MAG: hypothetical protein M1822_000983 [Bathelium mastoideum]
MAAGSPSRPPQGSLDAPDIGPLLEGLEINIDKLETSLEPILDRDLSETLNKLPVLDKAKLYIFLTYAVESILFSYLSLNGTNAKEHAVFAEITRVKQYFEKARKAAELEAKPKLTIDKDAARRFVTAGVRLTPANSTSVDAVKRKLDFDAKQVESEARRERKRYKRKREEKRQAEQN